MTVNKGKEYWNWLNWGPGKLTEVIEGTMKRVG